MIMCVYVWHLLPSQTPLQESRSCQPAATASSTVLGRSLNTSPKGFRPKVVFSAGQ